VRGVLLAPQLQEAPRGTALAERLRNAGVPTEEVTPLEFGSAAETESPQGVIAIAEAPKRAFGDLPRDWSGVVLVLDAVQDPGNVGTILRTAAALGAAATIALPGTVDLWNAKVVRSGMGAQFRHLSFPSTWNELDAFRSASGAAVLAADASGEAVGSVRVSGRTLLVVGNEGAGLSPEARSRADRAVALPISPDVESLNVAVATGILLYQLRQ
jgi:TrmH family RNA methyltransferase